ncbi:MAG: hypothetical protein A2W23_09665 [Planctomycetes bacterium RBG_16_43_13]|nr:MAG: hypothetical protein A2W23_09665 [Planctomycetes bacterium RBG_16_43_13]
MGKTLRILIPTAILFGFIVLPFIGVNYSPKQERPQQRKVSHLEFIKPLNQFLEEQRRILKYDKDGNIVPDLAKSFSATLSVKLKIKENAILPDGAKASYTTMDKYIKNVIASGKSDLRLKNLSSVEDVGNSYIKFIFSKLVSKSQELPYDLFGRNAFDETSKPQIEQIIDFNNKADFLPLLSNVMPLKTNKMSYYKLTDLTSIGKGVYGTADNIIIKEVKGAEWIAQFQYNDHIPKYHNIRVIPSQLKRHFIVNFNLRNPKYKNINRRKILYDALQGKRSIKLNIPIEIIYVPPQKYADKTSFAWKAIGCDVIIRKALYARWEDYSNNAEVFISDKYPSYLNVTQFHSQRNIWGYSNEYVDKLISELDETFESSAREVIKAKIMSIVEEDLPCIFLGEEPMYFYLVGKKEDLDALIKNMR